MRSSVRVRLGAAIARLTVVAAATLLGGQGALAQGTTTGATGPPPLAGRLTLDLSGNVIDATGKKVAYIVGGQPGQPSAVRISIDSRGIVTDAAGRSIARLIVGAADTTNEIAKVAADAGGVVYDRTGTPFGHIVAGAESTREAKQIHIDEAGRLIDASGATIGQAAVIEKGGYVDKLTQLEARIKRERLAGKITASQADRLSNEVEDVVRLEQQYTKERALTGREEASLLDKLDKIWGRLFQLVRAG